MTFIESIQTCFRKYAEFNGRASRSEFWWWILFIALISFAAHLIGQTVGALAALATLLPNLAVTSRRLHDINRSGWWQLVGFIPLVGWLIMIYWCTQGSSVQNKFG
ncbi:MAG TPA: DUF805 domain-containing protein [Gallionella sp.]|nr:DUF805 domain-containing protein [Gallionella sp.]